MSPSIRTMGFFMSEINFCNTKEQLNHLGEVVTGKTNGSPFGSDINTSTLPYTGQVRKTLPALEGEYEQSITNKEAEADAAIDAYRLLNKGTYASGITLESKFEYITYNGESYFATNPPYTTTATTPDADSNLFAGGYTTLHQSADVFSNTNLLSNHNFLTPSPDAITHPNATPESYAAGTQIFSGVYAGSSGVTVTLINGRVNCSAGSYEYRVPNTNGLDRVPAFTSSVSDYDGNPVTAGVSHALVSEEYVVTVTPPAGDVFSVKFEQGGVATGHETTEALTSYTLVSHTNCQSPSVASMKLGKTIGGQAIITSNILDLGDVSVSTQGYYGAWAALLDPQGAADYILTTLAKVRSVRGLGWVPDGWGDHYLSIGDGLTYVATIVCEVPNLKQFGAKGDGVTVDDGAIEAWIAQGNNPNLPYNLSAYAPPGDYVVEAQHVIEATGNGGFLMYGESGHRSERMGTRFLTNFNGFAFLAKKDGTAIKDLTMFNTSGSTEYGGIQFKKDSNADDAEFESHNCNFENYDVSISHEGRSCRVSGGTHVLCNVGVDLSWTNNGVYPPPPNSTDLPFGFRCFTITDIRFHTCQLAVRNTTLSPEFLRDVAISDCIMDLRGKLFEGGLNNATLIGNVVDGMGLGGTNAIVKVLSGGQNVNISNNAFTGYVIQGSQVPTRTGAYGIRFDVEAKNCQINSNGLEGFSTGGMLFLNGMAGTSVIGNSLNDNALGLSLLGGVDASIIMNTYTNNSQNLNDASTRNNSINMINGAFLEDSTGGMIEFFNKSGASKIGSISKKSAGVGGLSIDAENIIILNPTSTSVRPSRDANIDLGASTWRFEDGFFVNAPTGTSDKTLKTEHTGIPVELTAPLLDVVDNIALWKWLNSVSDKGEKARFHAGPYAQDVYSIFEDYGIDAFAFGFVGKDLYYAEVEGENGEKALEPVLDGNGNHKEIWSLRPTELQWLCLWAIRQKQKEIEAKLVLKNQQN